MGDQVKLLLSYNINAGQEQSYRRFVLEELLPQAQELGLLPTDAWHTAYGRYPDRLLGFVAEDLTAMRQVRNSSQWQGLMHRLAGYADDLRERVVPFRDGFQW